MNTLPKVAQFMRLLQQDIPSQPSMPSQHMKNLRIQLIQEELNELSQALSDNDIVESLDALCDLQYVIDGTFCALGLHNLKNDAFNEVHKSNMTKINNGKPIKDHNGKILKGNTYTPPNLRKIIDDYNSHNTNNDSNDTANNIPDTSSE